VYVRVQNCVSFIYNGWLPSLLWSQVLMFTLEERRAGFWLAICAAGRVVLDTPLPIKSHKNCRISSITPIAVSLSERTQFVVRGFDIAQPMTRWFYLRCWSTFYLRIEK
jgi:hypothetical protein